MRNNGLRGVEMGVLRGSYWFLDLCSMIGVI